MDAIHAYCNACVRKGCKPIAVFTSPYGKCRHVDTGKRKIWTQYLDEQSGKPRELPEHIIMLRDSKKQQSYFALICRPIEAIQLEDHGPLQAARYVNLNGATLQPGAPAHKGQLTTRIIGKVRGSSPGPT